MLVPGREIHIYIYIRSTPHPVTVTTRIITFLVGNPSKPSFATVTGWGVDPMYIYIIHQLSLRLLPIALVKREKGIVSANSLKIAAVSAEKGLEGTQLVPFSDDRGCSPGVSTRWRKMSFSFFFCRNWGILQWHWKLFSAISFLQLNMGCILLISKLFFLYLG